MFKAMLSPNDDPKKNPDYFARLKYPLLCSAKYDGIRALGHSGVMMSRENIELPSRQYQRLFGALQDFDGEFIAGEPTDFGVYNRTQSFVMSRDKPADDPRYYVFDNCSPDIANVPFKERLAETAFLVQEAQRTVSGLYFVEHTLVKCYDELISFENKQLSLGFEGIMMRDPEGRYKHGRGTFNEGLIYKLKRFEDFETKIIGFEEQMHNSNPDTRSNTGHAKRSSSKEGLVPAATLGKIIVDYFGEPIRVACGVLTHAQRKYIWEHQEEFLDKYAKCRHFPHGMKDLPRFPRFVGFRCKIDMEIK